MVTPDQGIRLTLDFDSIQNNLPSSTVTLSRLQILYFTSLSLSLQTNNGLQCDIVRCTGFMRPRTDKHNTVLEEDI